MRVAIPVDTAGQLSQRIDELRNQYGYRPEDLLKFNTQERPAHLIDLCINNAIEL